MDPISDEMLIAAARKRLMDELAGGSGGGDSARIVNNVYGAGGGGQLGGGGMLEGMTGGGGQGGEDPFDYFVDIERRDVTDPLSGEKIGWDKKVHRFRGSKKKAPTDPMVGPAGL